MPGIRLGAVALFGPPAKQLLGNPAQQNRADEPGNLEKPEPAGLRRLYQIEHPPSAVIETERSWDEVLFLHRRAQRFRGPQ
jgi:hypothetical protein